MDCDNCHKSEQGRHEAEHFLNASYKLLAFYVLFSVLAMVFLAWRIHELEAELPTTINCTQI